MSIFTNLWSWSFVAGLVAGFVLNRAWCLAKTCWLDKHRPLPDGRHRSKWRAVALDRRWLVGLLAVTFLGWSVITTSENAEANDRNAAEAKAFAERTQRCQSLLIEAIVESRKVTAEIDRISVDNDRLSREERQLLADLARYQTEWVGRLVNPPDRIKLLDPVNPVRQQYSLDVTRGFFNRAGEVNRRIEQIHREQDANLASQPAERPDLPDPECGAG